MELKNHFEIESKKIKIDALTEEQLAKLESQLSTLTTINIRGNSYSKEFCQQLGKLLAKADKLEYVDFQNIFVSRLKTEIPESLDFLGEGLIGKNVIELDLSDNAVNPFGAQALSKYLSQAKPLKKFFINNCGLGPEGTEIIAQSLAKGTINLEVLAIARNRAEDKGAKAVGLAVQNFENFRELHIFQDVIRKEGMVVLLQCLKKCKKLEILDIRDNFLKDEAITALAELLLEVPTINGLNISDCNLEEDDNQPIIDAIKASKHNFKQIGYNYAELQSDQAKELLDSVLASSDNIQRIDIKGNEFKKSVQQYYKEKTQEKGCQEALSLFESDSEGEDENVKTTFADLEINFNKLKL